MRHPRVRRPFVVETRGSGREGGFVAIPKRAAQATPQRPGPAAQTIVPAFDPWAEVTMPAEQTAPRRILPNIMAPPEPAQPEPEVEAAEEAPLPRVRRVKAPALRAAKPAVAALPKPAAALSKPAAAFSKPAAAFSKQAAALSKPAVAFAKPAAVRTEVTPPPPVPDTAPAGKGRLLPRGARTGRDALPAGQRWKARLPRSCW